MSGKLIAVKKQNNYRASVSTNPQFGKINNIFQSLAFRLGALWCLVRVLKLGIVMMLKLRPVPMLNQ